jgi:hypothetical protein
MTLTGDSPYAWHTFKPSHRVTYVAKLPRLNVATDRYIAVEYSIMNFLSLGSRQPLHALSDLEEKCWRFLNFVPHDQIPFDPPMEQ